MLTLWINLCGLEILIATEINMPVLGVKSSLKTLSVAMPGQPGANKSGAKLGHIFAAPVLPP